MPSHHSLVSQLESHLPSPEADAPSQRGARHSCTSFFSQREWEEGRKGAVEVQKEERASGRDRERGRERRGG